MKKDTRAAILETALAAFQAKGFDSVTVNEICTACGITKKTFYYHFPSKESALVAYYSESPPSKEALLVEMLRMDSCADRLWFLYQSLQKKNMALGPALYRVIVRHAMQSRDFMLSPYSSDWADSNRQNNFVLDLIAQGQARGEFTRAFSPEILFWSYNCGAAGAALNWCAHDGQLDESDGLRKMFEMIFFRPEGGDGEANAPATHAE